MKRKISKIMSLLMIIIVIVSCNTQSSFACTEDLTLKLVNANGRPLATSPYIYLNDNTVRIAVNGVIPSDNSYYWYSSYDSSGISAASVDGSGRLRPNKEGKTTISAYTKDWKSYGSFAVTVIRPPDSEMPVIPLKKGEEYQVQYIIYPVGGGV